MRKSFVLYSNSISIILALDLSIKQALQLLCLKIKKHSSPILYKSVISYLPASNDMFSISVGTLTTPGRTLTTSGRTLTTSGRTLTTSGRTLTTPGRTLTTPGRTLTTPGRTLTTPGRTLTILERILILNKMDILIN